MNLRILLALAAVGALGACTGDSAVTTQAAADRTGGAVPVLSSALEDIPPEMLLEPAPRTKSEELIQQAAQNTPFCALLDSLDEIEEPDPGDAREMQRYAERVYNLLYTFDPRGKVSDPEATTGRPRKVALPARIVEAVRAERAHMHAFLVRVRYAVQQFDAKALDAKTLRARVDDATVRLAASDYTEADKLLNTFRVKACVAVQ